MTRGFRKEFLGPGEGRGMTQGKNLDWTTWGQLVGSLLGSFTLIGICVGGIILIYVSGAQGVVPISSIQKTSSLLLLGGMGFSGLLLIPSAVYAARSLSGSVERRSRIWRKSGWLILLLPFLVGMGHVANIDRVAGRILLVIAHVLANGAAVFWVLHLGWKGDKEETSQRFWGVFGSGLTLGPALALLIEFVFLTIVVGIWYVYLLQHPALQEEITSLVQRLPQSTASPAILERVAEKYLFRPGVVISVFSYVAVIIPLVEELVKPIGVWLLAGRDLSPREGFRLGVLSGAGYALFENLTLSANAEVWSVVIITRLGTTGVHMLTSGMVGWGLASAWAEGKYLRLAKAFLVSVAVHGVWNALNILSAFVQFEKAGDVFGSAIYWSAQYASVGLLLIALGSIYGLLRSNRLL